MNMFVNKKLFLLDFTYFGLLLHGFFLESLGFLEARLEVGL